MKLKEHNLIMHIVKRKYLFLCLILLLLSVTAVSASNTDNITVQASADMSDGGIVSDIDEISVQEGNTTLDDAIAVTQADSQDKLAVSDDENMVVGLAFKDLQKLIDDAPEGSEITLDNDYYVASGGHAIHISKSITINGNNHTLDAGGNGRIASIEADGKSITFKNIEFENGKVSDDGGAILNTHSSTSLTLINCSFNNNKADDYGGAIYSKGKIKINGSNFINNAVILYLRGVGGAIYTDGDISINDSSFTNNTAENGGGAIYAKTIGIVSNSIFIRNKVIKVEHDNPESPILTSMVGIGYDDGGAIYINRACTPEFVSCRFEGNTADNRGGAIYLDSTDSQLKISYCTFIDNHANKKHNPGHSVFNSGHYNLMDMCWFGTNNPDFYNQLTKYNSGKDDTDYYPSNYLKIGIKINDTNFYVRNNYEVTVYFYDLNGNGLGNDLLHSAGRFSGDAIFTNLKVDYNDMTADANITKENCVIVGELDHQTVTLNLTASNKTPSNITIESLSIENGNGIRGLCTILPTPKNSDSLYYVIMNSESDIVRRGGMSKYAPWDIFSNSFIFSAEDLPNGSYSVTVINPETKWNLGSNDTRTFKILQNVFANITADNVVYGNTTTITLKADYDGLYNVSINDLVIEMNVTNGSCVKQVKLNAGKYETHTTICTTDYVELSCNEASFNVSKANPLFNLNVSSDEFIYGDEILVSHILPYDATGNISYSLNKEKYANLSVNDSLKLSLDACSYPIDATYSGDSNYCSADDSITINIKPARNKASVSVENVTYGEDTVIVVSTDVDGIYQLDINGTIYNVTVNNGVGNRTIALNAGTYYANATFNNKNYNTTSKNAIFTVYKADVKLNITVLDEVYPQDVEGVVHASRDGEYNLTVGKYSDIIVVKDGICYFNIGTLDAGPYEAIVSLNDDNYNPVSNSTKFVVNSSGTLFEIEVTSSEITYGETVTVTHTINDGATGNITYFLNDGTLLGVLPVGKNLTLPVLPVGSYVITANYSGDKDFIPASDIAFFTIKEDISIVSAPDVTKYYGGSERFVVTVTDSKGIPLANKSVTIVINGQTYARTTNANGTTTVGLNLAAGIYNATTTVANTPTNSVITILTTVNGSNLVKVFRNATQYYATFFDTEGNYLAEGTMIRFNINGVMYDRKVAQNGLAKLNINLQQGEYIITAMNLKTGEMSSNNITVIPKIIENNDLTKYYRNASQYTVKLIGDDGNPVGAGEVVTFNINGVFYNRTTNASGVVKLNINLAAGDYVITAEYKGCKVSNNIKVLPVLSSKDITMKYRDGTKFTATLVDGQGKPYAGQNVQFNINGVLYTRNTDSAGQAKLNINLMAGEYIITSSYNGFNIANKITIRG